ncbi:hypothetical protein MG3_03776 [Candida albicans P78048]|uniref:Uncharacterized protein n=1 Tax=Candida albicans P78048 TaxID=1094989 RepID=A0AB34PQ49_CANAX|nr:hypothetical protein MG3_03776 [Candida albicans P78048]
MVLQWIIKPLGVTISIYQSTYYHNCHLVIPSSINTVCQLWQSLGTCYILASHEITTINTTTTTTITTTTTTIDSKRDHRVHGINNANIQNHIFLQDNKANSTRH